ncbi:PorT family protein [Aureisphaera sp. CAU 1614]|uniref:PorT family protein n=1 Tax=Halomarinibacterium sedimenti TaxID=2857106 RepID=A0A9X1FQ66_9FLAO|nr:porin family protein [Halomarinibacterium sedimenti]MBW2938586.1 PorT family protein [Halomarinibacterium sedimenti]
MQDSKTILLFFLVGVISFSLYSQDIIKDSIVDTKYREDQFYAGVTYNLITKTPSGFNFKGVSGGIHFGFLRDMPINEQRNIAVAIGLGLSFDQYGQNLFIGEDTSENTIFSILDDSVDYTSNIFRTASIELPFEIRWRTSTPTVYKFWRVYAGVKPGYVYWYRSQFKQTNNTVSQTKIPEFQKLSLGATLAFGYGTFNFYANYSILPFFKDATLEDTNETISFNPLKIGIIFYIL